MKHLPLTAQTLYADLVQSVTFSTTLPASVYTQTIRGKPYLYAAEKHGGALNFEAVVGGVIPVIKTLR
jgi:hypothetical protein